MTLLAAPLLPGQDRWPDDHTNAQSYERFMGRWSRLVAPLLIDFAGLPDSGWVLDVGSGTGALAFAVAERKPKCYVLGIDPFAEPLAFAVSKNPFPERASFQIADAQRLPFPDATFAASVSLLVFNFIPDAAKALREVRRVTRPGGRVTAANWDYSAGMRMLRVFWDAAVHTDPAAEKVDEKHMPLCRSGELSKLWRQSGLTDVQEQPLEITMRFSSFADYWDPFLLGQGPAGAHARKLDPARQDALRAEVKRRLSISAENEPFSLPARAWAVRGTVPSS